MIDFVGVAWAWSTLSELLAYPNSQFFHVAKGVRIIEVGLYYMINHEFEAYNYVIINRSDSTNCFSNEQLVIPPLNLYMKT